MKTLHMTTLAAMVLAAGPALLAAPRADQDGPGQHARRSDGPRRMAEYLGLTDDQRAAWKSLHEQQRAAMEPQWQEGRALRERLRAATEAEQPDATAVGQATLALKQHREKMKASREAFRAQLDAVLTPEQRGKLEAFKAAHPRSGMRDGSRGRRGPKPGGVEPQAPDGPPAPPPGVEG